MQARCATLQALLLGPSSHLLSCQCNHDAYDQHLATAAQCAHIIPNSSNIDECGYLGAHGPYYLAAGPSDIGFEGDAVGLLSGNDIGIITSAFHITEADVTNLKEGISHQVSAMSNENIDSGMILNSKIYSTSLWLHFRLLPTRPVHTTMSVLQPIPIRVWVYKALL